LYLLQQARRIPELRLIVGKMDLADTRREHVVALRPALTWGLQEAAV
jgi:hypothetical protein